MISNTMQALFVETANGDFISRQVSVPQPGPGEVLVKVAASGVNPLDIKIRQGGASHACHALPAVLGLDMAGTVVAVGADVYRFNVGDHVFGMVGGVGNIPGTLAEYVLAEAALLAHKPDKLSMREAAALPLIFITAWEGLVDRAKVNQVKTVLVHGGAGGVGHMAVQIAKAHGARVYATVSARDMEAVALYGAIPIDYEADSVTTYVKKYTDGEGFDIIYDTVGGATLDASFNMARTYHGHVVSCLGWGTHALAPLSFKAATYSGVFTLIPLLTGKGRQRHGEILAEAAKLVDTGQLTIRVDPQRFSFKEVGAAYKQITSGQTRGKVVIEVTAE